MTEALTFVTAKGTFTAAELAKSAPKKGRPRSGGPDHFHKGWRVEGHPPGALVVAERNHNIDREERERMRSGGSKVTLLAPWNESVWRMNAKKKPVRAKPYEVVDAANVCKQLAEKAGWLDVVVVEIKREKVV